MVYKIASNGKNPPYDLLILQPDTIQRGIAANVLAPIDEDQAPNVKSFTVLSKEAYCEWKTICSRF